jgi:adenosine deaminase
VAAEVFLSPVIFTRRGLPFLEILDAIEGAAGEGERRGGPALRWILDGVRQWGAAGCEENLECARAARGRVLGIGLGGNEESVPAREFAGLFAEARRIGLHTVAHAGEFGGSRSVRDAVEWLGAERIGHGIRALEDTGVVRMLRREEIPLEVCPTSNLRTGVVHRWEEHPLPRLVRRKLRVTLNSDDPSLFHTSLTEEYRSAHRRLGLPLSALYRIHRQSIQASFLDRKAKRRLLRESSRIWSRGAPA